MSLSVNEKGVTPVFASVRYVVCISVLLKEVWLISLSVIVKEVWPILSLLNIII